jgi:hypothetical protein
MQAVNPDQFDLRKHRPAEAVARAERALGVQLDSAGEVVKRRTIGAATDRGTWVRVEVRRLEKLGGQGFNGAEAAATVTGVAKPAWLASVAWHDRERGVMWRADETELISAAPIKAGGVLTVDPRLPASWWATLATSLDALAAADTTRVATLHTMPITQARVTAEIQDAFGDHVDTSIVEWAPAHADFAWANLTGPECWILDWEDWGMAPRGLDAAMLWSCSLAVPGLAERVFAARRADLDSRDGQLMMLFFAAGVVSAGPDYSGPVYEPARVAAEKLLTSLA